ncbi:GNAT family acetyltransferase [Paenibacillus riograndensis]|uniref:GNAT family acetyltransferase n=1 Tax=Paenibacillus riograndensis TaxID=483937 RepID=A0A132TIG6_9BACL|nr:GNAT family N-acetyltransferase [Paenibacillus riograndensis]KWX71102.1 GNAT family acetyltransferase [Paenibacillus riograndensis]KWX86553.1 GNAT family acetyltransferase [Paenibacillus riograndensis]
MKIESRQYERGGKNIMIREAVPGDARLLSELRLQIDGETENLDREPGEALMTAADFEQLIRQDAARDRNLFLVAAVDGRLAAFCRCEGNLLKRMAHQAEFGIGVLQEYWGLGIGSHMLSAAIAWAEACGLRKLTLKVLETNRNAIALYQKLGFTEEGLLKNDKLLSDGKYYNTVTMGRWR